MKIPNILQKRLNSACTTLFGFVLISGSLYSVPQWELDFSSVTSGDPPPIATYQNGVVNTLGQTIVPGDPGQLTLQSTFTIGSASLFDAMVFSQTSAQDGTEYRLGPASTADFAAGASYSVNFNILLPAYNQMSSGPFEVRLTPGGTGGVNFILGRIVFINNGSVLVGSSYGGDVTVSDVWDPETVHNVSLQYDGNNDIFRTYFDNNLVGTINLNQADLPNNPLGVSAVRFRATGANATFDPIGISDVVAVPEPAHAVLISSLIVMFLVWRKNKSRS